MSVRLASTEITFAKAGRALVDNVSLALNAGELVGLVGPNGAGKSTLLSLLAGLLDADSGIVNLDGRELKKISVQERSRLLAWVAQSGPVNWPLTVERIIALGRRPHLTSWQKLSHSDNQAIERAIAVTDCEKLRHQDATTLSGGERTRMLLARALATEPNILLADEPIAALDLKHQLQTMQLLRDFATGEQACLVVLHDLSLASRYCDRLYLMNNGKLVSEGPPATVLSHDNMRDVYEVEVATGMGEVPYVVPIRER